MIASAATMTARVSDTADPVLEQVLDLAALAAVATTLAGVTFMLTALAAGWVRTPQQAEQPVAPR